jgi:hypothetical protein
MMSSVQEIQKAIEKLPETDYRMLERWWEAYQEEHWDAVLDRDSKENGRLSNILAEVDADIDAGNVTDFPR